MITETEISAALDALKQFPVLGGRVVEVHARAALEAAETARREAHRKALAIAKEEIEDSCGCVFCDLGYEPVEHDGKRQHHVRVSKGLRRTAPEPSWVPCTRPQ